MKAVFFLVLASLLLLGCTGSVNTTAQGSGETELTNELGTPTPRATVRPTVDRTGDVTVQASASVQASADTSAIASEAFTSPDEGRMAKCEKILEQGSRFEKTVYIYKYNTRTEEESFIDEGSFETYTHVYITNDFTTGKLYSYENLSPTSKNAAKCDWTRDTTSEVSTKIVVVDPITAGYEPYRCAWVSYDESRFTATGTLCYSSGNPIPS